MPKPDSPGRSEEAHDKPQGEGLGAPDRADTLPTDPIEDTEADTLPVEDTEAEAEPEPK
jgi:hypothetical protein